MTTELPNCRHRGAEVETGRWICRSRKIIAPAGLVAAEDCAQRCPFIDHKDGDAPDMSRLEKTLRAPPGCSEAKTSHAAVAVAITSAPRPIGTLRRTVFEFRRSGFCGPIDVFCEPGTEEVAASDVRVHRNEQQLGAWKNWLNAARTMLKQSQAEFIMICQDDLALVTGAGDSLRRALNSLPMEDFGYASLYTAVKHAGDLSAAGEGWHPLSPGVRAWGALAFCFTRDSLQQILDHPTVGDHRGHRDIDKVVSSVCHGLSLQCYYCVPSLCDHTGNGISSLAHGPLRGSIGLNFVPSDMQGKSRNATVALQSAEDRQQRIAAAADNSVSVIVPNHNCGRYLKECLQSLLQQTTPADIIVIDDGSQDQSREVLESFGTQIRWQGWDSNCGANAARNAGLQLTQSEWVVLADSDAVYREDYLETLLGTATDQDDVVYCPYRVIETETGQRREFPAVSFDVEQLWWENFISMCSLVRRSALPDTLAEDTREPDDWILWLSLASRGARFRPVRTTGEPLFTAYERADGKSARVRSQWMTYRSEVARQRRRHSDLIGLRGTIPVVIPGRECVDLTTECLSHLAMYSGLPLEVIYVDNGSRPATVLTILEKAEQLGLTLTLVRNATNRQFTAAVNQGLRLAAGRHAICLNTDCFVGPDCIERLYWHLTRARGKVAAVGPLTGDGGHQSLRLPQRRHQVGTSENLEFDCNDAVEGARVAHGPFRSRDEEMLAFFCVFLHSEALAVGGLLDESESAFASGLGADDEWCWRLRRSGWSMKLALDAYAAHLGGQSFKRLGIDRDALQKPAIERVNNLAMRHQ